MDKNRYLDDVVQMLERTRGVYERKERNEADELKLLKEQFANLKFKADFEDCNIAEIKNRFPNHIDGWGDEQPWYIEDDVEVVKNLFIETLCKLLEYDRTPLDVNYVANSNCFVSWDDFVKVAENIDYYGGYVGYDIKLNLKVVGDDWWLERHEYDGSEWWEFKTLPKRPLEKATTMKEITCMILSCERYTGNIECSVSGGECPRKIKELREWYPLGGRVELQFVYEKASFNLKHLKRYYPPTSGPKGTIRQVDNYDSIYVDWDSPDSGPAIVSWKNIRPFKK